MVDAAILVLEAGQSIGRGCQDTSDIAELVAYHMDNSHWDKEVEDSSVVDDEAKAVDNPDTARIAVVACEQEILCLEQMVTVLHRDIQPEEAYFREPGGPFAPDSPEEDMVGCLA